ncbi:MAG: phosphoribosylaminoimidazolesuccinocarboxamide synthase [Deltaproteobacteria bacterium]|nr:phosphoribosylaminoimidazolesuccinocarboxamide synthase [Deltaproteobacteria bacterium]MBI3293119.1 phosphoribosylaminoimidazolesuccinocarboxamide synthase [Deltaproteobacteria bacterium]
MTVNRGSQIREGKAKILYQTDRPGTIIQYFKDDATAFNALKKGQIKDKGILNNAISCWMFKHLEKSGVKTHFLERLSDREMLVKKLEIIPVEVVIRNRATGSILKRLGLAKGRPFQPPLIEYFYKSDELSDPLIGETHIAYFKWATDEQLAFVRAQAFKVNDCLCRVCDEVGLELIDFKLEFGLDEKDEVLLGDEFTPDGCRLWDKKTGEPMDKDRFRQDLGGVEEAYREVYRRLESFFGQKT